MGFSILSVEEIDTPFVLQDEQPDDIARFSASAVILVMALNGLPYTFFVYEHRYAKMMNVKAKRTPGRSPGSHLRGALRHPAKLFWALRNERRKKKST